ncbi:MAG: hypothetical protein HZA27_00315 [Candidatus Omnitrophica bacterium]|nr:hypothetical protein [Candidatus Omnitrophota bacterium]
MKRRLLLILLVILFTGSGLASEAVLEDISSVRLNSVLVENKSGFIHLTFSFQAKKAAKFEGILDTKKATQKSLEYFFLSLILRENIFWVNLNPDTPSKVVNPIISETDLGRILLNADLRLKDDAAALFNPQNSEAGREFWAKVYKKAEELGSADKIPLMNRFWIVPGEVEIAERDNQISILKATLKVCLESEFTHYQELKDERLKALQDYASGLMQELILPLIEKRVNEAYTYADLRDVFHAFILAKCYREKFNVRKDYLLQAVDFEILKDTETTFLYSQAEIYQDYLRSVKNGYSFSEKLTEPFFTTVVTRHYFSGGINFRNIVLTRIVDSPTQTNPEEDIIGFTCDLSIPQGLSRPLQYARENLTLTPGISPTRSETGTFLVKDLPAITALRFAEQKIENLDFVGKTDRLVLGKL